MAFNDALIGDNDFDPRTATEDLIRQGSSEPLPDVLDPRMLNTRLARKLGNQPKAPEPTPSQDLDFSSQAAPPGPVDTTGGGLDFSTEATSPDAAPVVPPPPLGVTGNLKAAAKGLPTGAVEGAGGVMKGAARLHNEAEPYLQSLEYDPMGNVVGQKPVAPQAPIEQHPLYKAGEAVSHAHPEMTEQERESLGGRVGTGIGTIAPYAAATAINPALGLAAGFTGMAADSYGQVYEEAKKKGASDEVAQSAAKYSALTAGVLGSLPLPAAKLATSVMGKIAVSGVTFATLGEFQDAILKEIAQHTYDPSAGYSVDAKRIMAALIVGGAMGGMHAAADKMRGEPQPPAGPGQNGPGAPGGELPPPAPGGPRSSPEDIADFVQQARTGNRTQHTESDTSQTATPPRNPADMNDAELSEAFQAARASMGDKSLEEILRAGGYSPDTVKHMDERGKVEEAIGIARAYAAEAAEKAGKGPAEPTTDKTDKTSGPQQEGLKPEAPVSHLEYAVLREYGYSDEDIGNMGSAQRRREVQDAYDEGIKPGEAMGKHKPPDQAMGKTEAPVDRAGAAGTVETGLRNDPIRPATAEDVARAQPVEPKSQAQAEAENYQHAHMELPHLGLSGKHSISIETGMGQERHGTDANGKDWSVTLRHAAYGRIKGTKGADGKELDILVGPSPQSPHVFIIDQHHPGAGFDEHKILAGFMTPIDALHAYTDAYDDYAKDRIGNVVAFTPEQFEAWRKGDTTKPIGASPSAPPAPTVADTTGAGVLSTEAEGSEGASPSVPKVSPAEAGVSENETTTTEDGSNVNLGSPVDTVEAHSGHYDAIETALGPDADMVPDLDIARAAEILAANEGMPPEVAFGHAVIENAVEGGFLTEQEAVQAYGEEVKSILEPGGEGASGGGTPAGQGGAASEQERAGGAEEAGSVSRGGEGGQEGRTGERPAVPERTGSDEPEGGHRPVPERGAKPEATEHEPTGGNRPAGDEAGNAAEPKPATAADLEVERKRQEYLSSEGYQHTKAIEDAIDAIEKGIEAKDRPAALKAAKEARKILAEIPQSEKDSEPDYWKQIEPLIRRMLKPGYVTGTQEAAAQGDATAKKMLEDAGQKIGGARKDAWGAKGLEFSDLESMTPEEKKTNFTKGNVFKQPDWPEVVAGGVDPVAAALMKRMYDRLPVKPNTDRYYGDEADAAFIKALKLIREKFQLAKTVDDAKAISRKVEISLSYSGMGVIYPKGGRINPLAIGWKDERAAKQAVEAGFPTMEPWARYFEVRDWGKGEWAVYRKNGGRMGEMHASKEAAVTAAKALYDGFSSERKKEGGEEPKRPHLDRIERTGPDYRKGRDVTGEDFVKDFGFRGVEFGNWVASDERQKSVNFAYDALHDLARVMGIAPKALSLNGTLSVAFGARGRGGKAAAHYEPGRRVINLTKLSGAGTLAHEYGHALDHHLGWFSGEDKQPGIGSFEQGKFQIKNKHLSVKLRSAVNRLMHDFHEASENDEQFDQRQRREIESAKSGQNGWIEHVRKLRERKAAGGSASGLAPAEYQIEVWGRKIKRLEEGLATGKKKTSPTRYLTEAQKLSGPTGDYWKRPTELLARGFETYVHDKLADEGFTSQYLVQGVEANRFGNGFRGNPYPVGDERARFNADFDRVFRGIEAVDSELGRATRLQGAQGEPEPVEEVQKVSRPEAHQTGAAEAKAVAESAANTLASAFEQHFSAGNAFKGILEARKFAVDKGFSNDPKSIEEAIEYAIVRLARKEVAEAASPKAAYRLMVDLYGSQPRLGTRTSTSIRDQAYSTPAPLAYLAQRLAGITKESTVYEPTAGNGALLTTADPDKVLANEINPVRAGNLRSQGFKPMSRDATEPGTSIAKSMDAVIANPPFGAVREEGQSKVFDLRPETGVNYQTTEIDHAIAIKALAAMKDDGKAVLILGGINKLVTTEKGRADAYQGKSKREFFKALYDTYGVTDHFTVNGDLYERQGAGWPVDVVVIDGRRKSHLPLPSVVAPRIYNTWDELGGLLNGQQATGGVQSVGEPAVGTSDRGQGLEGSRGGDSGLAGSDQPGPVEPGEVRGQRGNAAAGPGEGGGVQANDTGRSGQGVERDRNGEQPPAVDDFDAAFDAALDDAFGTTDTKQAFIDDAVRQSPTTQGVPEKVQKAVDSGVSDTALILALTDGGFGGRTIDHGSVEHRGNTVTVTGPFGKVTLKGKDLADSIRRAFPATGAKVAKPAKVDTRTTPEVAKSAAKNVVDAADEGFSALYDLFGGNKASSGFTFDEQTYAKAKPHFEAAAGKFAEFKSDLGELLKRMVGHLRDALKFTREAMERIKPYLKRFIDDMRAKPEAEPAAKPQRVAPVETENQVVYKPQSKVNGLDTLIPVNMAKPTFDALAKLEAKVGQIDTFVSNELGFTPDQMTKYFGAEQVDALGLAIDAIKGGKGFIIGDQTGIGKGRVNAAIIRWAIKNDRMPVFLTEKPNLYKDMFRDLMDTGISDGFLDGKPRILATNAALNLPLEDGNGAAIKTADAKTHNAHLMSVLGNMGEHYDMVFSTYNQMQTKEGKDTDRRAFLNRLTARKNGIVIIMDESHNAGGQKQGRKNKSDAPDRASFLRDIIQKANGVFYSSATYAKRPDVMDLYAATDMAMAVDNLEDLSDAIARGGVPMQQAVASMLAKAGQYIRRERSFNGINYNTPMVPIDRAMYDGISRALSSIQDFSSVMKSAAEKLDAEVRAEGDAMGYDGSVGDAGASSTNFTAVMHNVVNQMLLAAKANDAADRAIAAIKSGQKPVLTVANTMEAFLQDYSDNLGLNPGDEMKGDFGHVLLKYLDRTRTVLIKKPFKEKGDKPIRKYLTDDELGPNLISYNRAKNAIEGLDLKSLPLSPIDFIKGRLKEAGYDTGEITGRTLMVDYSGKVPVFASRSGSEKTARGRTETLKRFNTRPKKGGYHALIINQAGSTGLSAHASSTFDDQSRRRMLIVQPEGNIDTHMQLLGRINRTGQVVLPEYDQLVADVPAEKRPAAVLAKKMASLNANTTASRSSAVTAKDTPDFINQYGDAVAAAWVLDNIETHWKMGAPIKIDESGKPDKTDAMRKLTGRIPLLPLEQQEAVYQSLEGEYNSLLAQLEAAGENALEAKSLDLKARLIERMEVQGKRNSSGSPFAAPVVMQKVSIARIGKPFTPRELIDKLHERIHGTTIEGDWDENQLAGMLDKFGDPYSISGKEALAQNTAMRNEALERFKSYSRAALDDIEKPEEQANQKTKLDANKDRFLTVSNLMMVGRRVVIKTATNNLSGVVLDVKQQGHTKNPLALGSWKATFAIADASRQLTLPFSRMFEVGKADENSELDVEIEPMTKWYEPFKATLDRYQHMQSEAREERWVAGGNILAGYDWLNRKGAIINYTSDKGTTHQGILTARGFDPVKRAMEHGRIEKDPAAIKAYLDDTVEAIHTGDLSIQKDGRYGRDYVISTHKAKSKGGIYYLDKKLTALTGDFTSKGGNMVAYVTPDRFAPVIQRLQELGAKFKLAAAKPTSDKPGEGEEPQLADASVPTTIERSPEEMEEIKQAVTAALRHMLGDHVTISFTEPQPLTEAMRKGWSDSGDTAVGVYYPWRKLIELSMDRNLASNTAHEAYHAVEYQLQTPEERALMERETPRIREWVKKNNKKYGLKPEQFDKLSGEEIRAIGFEDYAKGRMDGLHIGVKRWYHKMLQMLQRLGNALRGLGYKTYEDIFGKVYEGGYRNASGATPREGVGKLIEPELAAVRPGGSRSGPPPMSETIAERLRDRGLDRMAGLSKKLGIGKVNPTEIRTKLQDKMIRVRNVENSVGGVPSQLSAYQAESLYYGRTGERLERLEKQSFDPLIKMMHEADISLGDINGYLYARHAPERNAYIDTINPNLGGDGSGMSDADAASIMAAIGNNRIADYERVAAAIDQITTNTRDTLVGYGLISQETADEWAQAYAHYVPLRGFAEGSEDEELMRGRFSGGYDTRGKEAKAAFGRKSEADGPLQYIMMQAESAVVRGEKNKVGNTFLRFVRANPDADRWQVNAPTIKRRIDPRTGLVTSYADFNYHNEPDAFVTKVGGKPMVIRLYGKDGLNTARALKQMGSATMNSVVRALHTLTSIQSRLSTQWNPNFIIPNFARDLGEAFINMQAQDQQDFVKKFSKHLFPAMRGAFKALSGRGTGPYVDAFHEIDKAGGRIRFFGLDDPDDIKRNISRKMRKLEGGAFNNMAGALGAIGHGFEIVNGAVENATRLAAYMAARDVGMSAPDAAMLARNLTVDFNKKGEWGPAINSLYMFANANLQGGARLARGLGHKRVRRAVYALAAMGALGALYNILVGGDDDDGESYYSKIKPYIRDKNLILMWPKGWGHDGKYVKIPLPYGFAPFHVLGDRATGVAMGNDKVGESASALLSSVADAFNPLGEESSIWMQMVPTMLRPAFHIATNKNWTGNPLYPDNDYNKTRPDSEKAFRSNSGFAKSTAKTLNSISGGSPYKSGWLDFHAGSIDHVLETVTGGLGKFVMDVVKTGGAVINGDLFDETKAPIIRRFVGTTSDPASDNSSYYAAREEARKAGGENLRTARKDLHSGKNTEEAESFIEGSRQAKTGEQLFKRADEQMKPLRARRDRIEADNNLSVDERRNQLNEITQRMQLIQSTARKRYKELKEGVHVQ